MAGSKRRAKRRSCSVEALLAVPDDSLTSSDFSDAVTASLEDLTESSEQLPFDLANWGTVHPKIEWVRDPGERTARLFRPLMGRMQLVRISAAVEFSGTELDSDESVKGSFLEEVHRLSIGELFCRETFNLILAASLSRPGSVGVEKGQLFLDERPEPTEIPLVNAGNIQEAVRYVSGRGWPELKTLPLAQVWSWIRQFGDFTQEAFTGSQVGRALNALARTVELPANRDPMRLFWAMMGVEALYLGGNLPIVEQLKKKTRVLLGDPPTFRDVIAGMCELRSGFVHGALDFPNRSAPMEAVLDSERDEALGEAASVSLSILIATLQHMVERNSTTLQFRYERLQDRPR